MADLMHTKDIVFKVKNIFKQIKKQTIINNVLFLVRRNSIKVFAGENGAGKSTLMRICTGNDLDFEGSLYFNNKNMNDIKEAKSFLFVATDLIFPQNLNAFEYVQNYFQHNLLMRNLENIN